MSFIGRFWVSIEADCEGLTVVEDCAYGPGTTSARPGGGSLARTLGGAFSFGVLKPLTAGEGGALVTNSEDLAAFARRCSNYGVGASAIGPGLNLRMTELQAALLCSQLERFDEILAAKKRTFHAYMERLGSLAVEPLYRGERSNYAFSVIRLPPSCSNVAAQRVLGEAGIESQIVKPLHLEDWGFEVGHVDIYENAENVYRSHLCLPSHLRMSDADVNLVCRHLERAICAGDQGDA